MLNVASFVAVMGASASTPSAGQHPLLKELFAKDPERAAKRLVQIPMGRFGEPKEMAKAALFLAGDPSTFVSASTFLVDSGLSAAYLTPSQAGYVAKFP